MDDTRSRATAHTRAFMQRSRETLPAESDHDFELARKGLIGTLDKPFIPSADGTRNVWDLRPYDFLTSATCPPTVHPGLWRQARLNLIHGLFEVTPGIYQVRGFDLSNVTIVEGTTGIIVIDPLVSVEPARAALELYFKHRGRRAVSAIIYTHSHADHYGGVRGVIDDETAAHLPIIAPHGFLQEAISENLFAGHAMLRRAVYFSGAMLERGATGHVDTGLGKSVSNGQPSLLAPTDSICATGETRTIDGVEIIFQMAPETEAPVEMMLFFPQFAALCTAEVATPTMHNIYTPRGAQVRNARNWWRVLDETIQMFGSKTDVLFAQHFWPRWGRGEIHAFLSRQRDLYKFMHDQALRLMNHGCTPAEIAEAVRLPKSLAGEWYCREYYGTLRHNVKGVYQKYLGWYDSNPANLDPHPPVEAGRRYVEFMGGADEVVRKARVAFEAGDYRWVAEVLKHVVFSTPDHEHARLLQADAMEQLGYQAESAPWRNEYLVAAHELRHGRLNWATKRAGNPDQIRAMTPDLLLDYLGIRLNAERAEGLRFVINMRIADPAQDFVVRLENSALTYTQNARDPDADVTFEITRAELNAFVLGPPDRPVAVSNHSGNADVLKTLLGMLDTFSPTFAIVTPD
ncbi:alkyl sulfatase dimerization domain-containing protein [Roseiarcaceae bacterium H3SJ34-1]|uniref:alkyl/aryl-sulfatase n=1 Tax=Terripilifer ovatus TaxID=3032367 RepID=UPI003AB92316|nr:alkyl sulfatase dimerization domain-containing protein [Roseiarcaceae bacterium H3SJ34-1]